MKEVRVIPSKNISLLFVRSIVAILVLLLSAQTAWACMQCQFAYVDYILPPVQLWCVIAVFWYFITTLIVTIFNVKLNGMPTRGTAWILLLLAFIASFIMLGALALLPLIIAPIISFITVLRNKNRQQISTTARRTVIVVGCIASLAVMITTGVCIRILNKRTDAQFIVQWSGTLPSIGKFYKLKSQRPENLNAYRYIIKHSDDSHFITREALKRIGAIGDPAIDIPMLKKMERIDHSYRTDIQEAIDSLSLREKRKGASDHDTAK
jgi:hypothetical protein